MATNTSIAVAWHMSDMEIEVSCSLTDKSYLDRLFLGVESHDLSVVEYFSDEHLRYLCRIRRLFPSEWSSPKQEKQSAYQRACLLGHTDIVQHMLQVGVKIDQEFSLDDIEDTQRSAFMFACHSDSLSTIRVLLQALSNDYVEHFKCRNRKGICSASFAKQYLIPQNIWVEQTSDSATNHLEFVFPIHFAIVRDNLEMVRLIVTGSNGELETRNGWQPFVHGGFTPLHIACMFNRSIDMIQLLFPQDENNVNPLLQTSDQGLFADQMTNERAVIEYLRPKRLSMMERMERERLKDLEEMQSGRPYQIFIKPMLGDTITMTVTGQTTTAELGAYFENKYSLPLDYQKFVYCGQTIVTCTPEIRPLVHYGIKKDSIVNIIWKNPTRSSP